MAARAAGRGPWAIGLRHVLPNVAAPILVQLAQMASVALENARLYAESREAEFRRRRPAIVAAPVAVVARGSS